MQKPEMEKTGHSGQSTLRLLVLAGLSPQVVTEALYLLSVVERQTVKDIKVFTTPEGKKTVENVLLLESDNPMEQLCRAYRLNRKHIGFGVDDVISIWRQGSDDENRLQMDAADQMMSYLSRWTSDGEPPLAVCVAGGRKNMGVLFAQVFSLLARPLDRLFHLFVTPEFEHLPGFFFPPPEPAVVESYRKGCGVAFLNSEEARITAVEIPVIRLRSITDEATRKGLLGFSGSRERTQNAVESTDPRVYLNTDQRTIYCRGIVTDLRPREFALYHFFCRIRKEGPEPYRNDGIPANMLDDPLLVEWLEQSYRLVKGVRAFEDLSWIPREKDGTIRYMENKEKVSHSISKIKQRLGTGHPARIFSRKRRAITYYYLELDPEDIEIDTEIG